MQHSMKMEYPLFSWVYTSSVCFDVLIIDDEENEHYEYFYFNIYFYNGSLTQFIDILRIGLSDNEEGQFSHQSMLNKDSNMTPMVHVYKSIDCTMLTVLHLCLT